MIMNSLPFEVIIIIYQFDRSIRYTNRYYKLLCQHFHIKDTTNVNKNLAYIYNNYNIYCIRLDSCKSINIIGYNKLSQFHNLRSLSLSNTTINNNCLQKICKLTNLERLNISSCFNLSYTGFKYISNLTKLEILAMDDIFTTSNIFKLIVNIEKLKVLSIKGCYIVEDSIYYLNQLNNLTTLYCDRAFTTVDIFYLTNNVRFVSLSSIVMLIPDEFKSYDDDFNNSIKSLILNNLKIVNNITNLLHNYNNLQQLSIQGCKYVNAEFLVNVEKCCPKLLLLNIVNCHQFTNYNFHNLKKIKFIVTSRNILTKNNICKKCKYTLYQNDVNVIYIIKCNNKVHK